MWILTLLRGTGLRILGIGIATIVGILAIRHNGAISEREKHERAAIKSVEIHGKVEKNVMSLSDSELDDRMQRYYRD